MNSQLIKKQVAIIGAGPIGLTAALFLEKLGFDYALLERRTDIFSHPAAHLINLRSMESLSEIGVHKAVYSKTEDINKFRYYRYIRRLLEPNLNKSQFALHDHFAPSPEAKQQEIYKYSFSRYVHLPQPKFVEVLHEGLSQTKNLFYGCQVLNLDNNEDGVKLKVRDVRSNKVFNMESEYLIACDGFHSIVRKQQGINMLGNPNLQTFLNIYFHSQKLASLLDEQQQNAMLHFIYNSDITACLVNHSKKEGMFVLQVPIYPPYNNFMDLPQEEKFAASLKMINQVIYKDQQLRFKDIEIKNVGVWALSAMLIEKYYKNRVIFAGDSAHSFPPAGGFGMNTGIQEIQNLMHKMRILLTRKELTKEQKTFILECYNKERKQWASSIRNTAMKYYSVSLDIPRKLGLSIDNLLVFKNALDQIKGFMPAAISQKVFDIGVKFGSYQIELLQHERAKEFFKDSNNLIPMIFYKEDTMFKYEDGFISKDDKEFAGQLLPHLYLNFFFGDQQRRCSTRQLSYIIDENLDKFNNNIVFKSKYYNQNGQNKYYMLAIYQTEDISNKIQQFIENLNELQIKPNVVFGICIQKANQKNNKAYAELENYEFVDKLFSSPNEQFILLRSDSHVYGRYTIK